VRSAAGCLRFETIEIRCSNVRRVILVRPHLLSKPDRRADRSSPKCLPLAAAVAYWNINGRPAIKPDAICSLAKVLRGYK
jgi:hypothetical protein